MPRRRIVIKYKINNTETEIKYERADSVIAKHLRNSTILPYLCLLKSNQLFSRRTTLDLRTFQTLFQTKIDFTV